VTFTRSGEACRNTPRERIAGGSVDRVYDIATRTHALELLADGRSMNSVSKETGTSRSPARKRWR
jgi:hypothetical protein